MICRGSEWFHHLVLFTLSSHTNCVDSRYRLFCASIEKKKEELVRLAIIHKNYSPRQIDKIFGTK